MKKIIFILFLIGFISANVKAQNSVMIKVTGIENPSGKLYIALFDSKSPFLSNKAIGRIVEIEKSAIEIMFDNLEQGSYAVTMFQDENSNGKLDLGEYDIPSEKYGFSNNVDPAILSRPPFFDECKFQVEGKTIISIKLISAIK